MKSEPTTLLDYLQIHTRLKPDTLYARYLFPDRAPVEMSYRQTAHRTRQFAAHYAWHGIGESDVVLIMLPWSECCRLFSALSG